MASISTIHVTISPEAAAHVATFGQQCEFEQILDYVSQLPGLAALNVILAFDPEGQDDPRVLLDAYFPPVGPNVPRTYEAWDQWCTWMIANFTGDVTRHFMLMPISGEPHAR